MCFVNDKPLFFCDFFFLDEINCILCLVFVCFLFWAKNVLWMGEFLRRLRLFCCTHKVCAVFVVKSNFVIHFLFSICLCLVGWVSPENCVGYCSLESSVWDDMCEIYACMICIDDLDEMIYRRWSTLDDLRYSEIIWTEIISTADKHIIPFYFNCTVDSWQLTVENW